MVKTPSEVFIMGFKNYEKDLFLMIEKMWQNTSNSLVGKYRVLDMIAMILDDIEHERKRL